MSINLKPYSKEYGGIFRVLDFGSQENHMIFCAETKKTIGFLGPKNLRKDFFGNHKSFFLHPKILNNKGIF